MKYNITIILFILTLVNAINICFCCCCCKWNNDENNTFVTKLNIEDRKTKNKSSKEE